MARRILISAFYTNDAYAVEAARLCRSIERLPTSKLAAHVLKIASVGWKKAVMWKPRFLLDTLCENLHSDVFYVDADAEFLREPDWAIFDGVDVSWHSFRRHPSHDAEYLTGSLFLRNTPDVRAFVKCWAARTQLYEWSDTPEPSPRLSATRPVASAAPACRSTRRAASSPPST